MSVRSSRRARARVALCVACALIAPTFASIARADAYESAMAQGVVARDRAEEGSDPKAWDEALRAFQEADRIRATKEARFELASAAVHLHAEDIACEAFEGAIALGLSGKAKDKADAFLAENLSSMARLDVVGPAAARVLVQGRERGVLPLSRPIVVFAGKVRVRLVTADGQSREAEVVTTAQKTARVDLTPEVAPTRIDDAAPKSAPTTRVSSTLDWVLVGAGSALFAGGLVTYVVANGTVSKRRDDLARDCAVRDGDECTSAAGVALQGASQSDVDAIATAKTLRIVGLAGAGLGAAAAIVGAIRLATMPRETTATVQPTAIAIPGGMFLGVNGAF